MKKPLAIISVLVLYCSVIQMNNYRLPKTVIPYFYNITTAVYPDLFYFKGRTEIHVDIVAETYTITLHALKLTISHVYVFFGEEKIDIESREYQKEHQFLIINFKEMLKVGKYKLWFQYESFLTNNLRGFYSTNYTPTDGSPRNLAVTYFEPTDARRAFPCFDEPAFKANFSISVISRPQYVALSNMPLQNSVHIKSGMVCNIFETTPKMSTYFVAFAVCDYERISYPRGYIYTRASYIHHANLTASILSRAIETTENYLQVKLPVSKLDIITVRQMPGVDGMENWGLILLMEDTGLYKEGVNTEMEKQDAILITIHECVHQWFGDLVTCDWWNDIWLNEGVTTFVEPRIAEKIFPQWRLREQAIFYWIRTAVEADGLEGARSMSQRAEQPSYYQTYFDYITYSKAASVLLTLESIVGEEIFKRSLQLYLEKHKYSTATGKDFWDAFQKGIEEADFTDVLPRNADVLTVMQTWEKQAGIPVVTVTRTYSPPSIEFSQKRYLWKKTKNYTTEWYIPINSATRSKPYFNHFTPSAWLTPGDSLVSYNYIYPEDWLIVNKQASFYYLVNYDKTNWKLIAAALESENFGNIPPFTRAKLLYDAFMLALSGELKYSVALQLIKYVGKEKDFVALSSFFYVFAIFYTKFSRLENFHHIQTFLSNALQPAIEHFGIEEYEGLTGDAQHVDTLNRIQIIKWTCLLGNPFCRNATTHRLISGVDTISVDLKEAVVCGGLRGADISLWNKIFQKSMEDGDAYESKVLGCSENKDSLDIYMEQTLVHNISVFYRIYRQGTFGTNYALDYLAKHWSKVNESLSEKTMVNVITGLAERLTTREQLTKLQSLKPNLTTLELKSAFDKAITKVDVTVRWINLHTDDINLWIREELESRGPIASVSLNVAFVVLTINFKFLL